MDRSPERISSLCSDAAAADWVTRPSASRTRASTSAGPAWSTMTSSRPQSGATAARPPSVTTAMSGTDVPVARSTRLVERAASRSRRASSSTRSAGGASTSAAASSGSTRTVCPSSPSVGKTSAEDPGAFVRSSKVATSSYLPEDPRTAGDAAQETFGVQNSRVHLVTQDGERLAALHVPGPAEPELPLAVVVAHGFTGSIDRPAVRAVVDALSKHAGVVAFDFPGQGRSSGHSTLGDKEALDLDAAVRHARELGYADVVTCGWSMGGSVVLRHAALMPEVEGQSVEGQSVDGVVSVSAVSRWFYRDTKPMRRLHWAVESRFGRMVARHALKTRITAAGWVEVPESPVEVVGRIAPIPLLLVHGDADHYFPVEHPEALFAAASEPKELWLLEGFGHAENAAGPELLDRIGAHLGELVSRGRVP